MSDRLGFEQVIDAIQHEVSDTAVQKRQFTEAGLNRLLDEYLGEARKHIRATWAGLDKTDLKEG